MTRQKKRNPVGFGVMVDDSNVAGEVAKTLLSSGIKRFEVKFRQTPHHWWWEFATTRADWKSWARARLDTARPTMVALSRYVIEAIAKDYDLVDHRAHIPGSRP